MSKGIQERWTQELGTGRPEFADVPRGHRAIIIRACLGYPHFINDSPYFILALTNSKRKTEGGIRSILGKIPELNRHKWTWHQKDFSMLRRYWMQSSVVGAIEHDNHVGHQVAKYWYEIMYVGHEVHRLQKSKWYIGEIHAEEEPVFKDLENMTFWEILAKMRELGISVMADEVTWELRLRPEGDFPELEEHFRQNLKHREMMLKLFGSGVYPCTGYNVLNAPEYENEEV